MIGLIHSRGVIATATIAACLSSSMATAAPKAQLGYVTGVFAGQPDNAGVIPNFDKVSGTNVDNFDIAVFQAVLTHGLSYNYTVAYQVNSFKGTCETSYALTQVNGSGVTVTLDASTIYSNSCEQGQVFFYYKTGAAVPNSPGPATLTGMVKFGKKTVKLSLPVLIK